MSGDDEIELDLAAALGAIEVFSHQKLSLYIPDKNRRGEELGTQRRLVLQAAGLLAEIGGGVTIMPAVEGGWFDERANAIVWERPVIIYTYVNPNGSSQSANV